MSSREKILSAVKANQPSSTALPAIDETGAIRYEDALVKFRATLEGIGGTIREIDNLQEVIAYVKEYYTEGSKYITSIDALTGMDHINIDEDPHQLEDVEVAVIQGDFAVAENAAIWVTTSSVKVRVLPFICQHLVVLLDKKDILHNMHQAYTRIGNNVYDFGVFIAGPSKTADIEQSLVLGAHGPKSLTVFLV
jgi:L-lactate dehydrogenase complex protein LldG